MFRFPGAPRNGSKLVPEKRCECKESRYYRKKLKEEAMESAIKIEQDIKEIERLNQLVSFLSMKIEQLEKQVVEKDELLASYENPSNN